MAKDLYKGRQMYQGPWVFYALIPIGAVILMFLVDLCYKYYNEYTLKRDTKDVLYQLLEAEDLETQEDYKNLAKKRFEALGYEAKDVTVILREDYMILINYKSYFSVIGELITGDKKVAVARFKGYLNEYKEATIEEYSEDDVDSEYENKENDDPGEPVVIPSKS